MTAALLLAAGAAQDARAAAGAAPGWKHCDRAPGTLLVQVARATCAAGAGAAAEAVAAADPVGALRAAGWTPLRAARTRGARPSFDLVALRGRAALRLQLRGATPDLDAVSAGRELVFARGRIVGGRPIPRRAAFCTSGFVVRLRGGRPAVLTAGHCAGLRADGRTDLRNAAMRRRPQPGIVLGRVLRTLLRSAPLDALTLPVPGGVARGAAPVVDRGITRPPLVLAGAARAVPGRRVCFGGRTSGPDRCGIVRGARRAELLLTLQSGRLVRCTSMRAAPGDSGGPVYTAPRADGTVRALGLVTLGVGARGTMCFTPIGPVLQRLGAEVATAT